MFLFFQESSISHSSRELHSWSNPKKKREEKKKERKKERKEKKRKKSELGQYTGILA